MPRASGASRYHRTQNNDVSPSHVVVETTLGNLAFQLFDTKAPLTTRYFLDRVEQGYYDHGDIYRSSQLGNTAGPYLLQGGAALPLLQDATVAQRATAPLLETIEVTGTTGIQHVRGTISLARDLGKSGKALPEFFMCLGNFPALDENGRNVHDTQGFPAFGQITQGIELLDKLARQETKGQTHSLLLAGQMLTTPLKLLRVYQTSADSLD